MSIKSTLSAFFAGVFITFACMNLVQAAGYIITDLGTLGGTSSIAKAINESGQITGYSDIRGDAETHAFIYSGGNLHDLGTFGGTFSSGQDINDLGHVTGYGDIAGIAYLHAYIYDGNTVQDLDTLGGNTSYGYSINNWGQVTGKSSDGVESLAFVYDASGMRDLGTLGGTYSYGLSINDSGQVTGSSGTAYDDNHAFRYDPVTDTLHDLGVLEGLFCDDSFGQAINDIGHVTGWSEAVEEGIRHAFLHDGTTLHDLGTLGGTFSYGYGINNHGHVVGRSIAHAGPYTAFLYDGTTMLDLCLLTDCASKGWSDLLAEDINDNGAIAGWGEINGEDHGFLIAWTDQPIPEICTDGIDNDDDGLADCDDDDCEQDLRCYVPPGMVYDLIDLGTLGGEYSRGNSINNSGQITGTSGLVEDGATRAFLYDNGEMQPLDPLLPTDNSARGFGINDHGQVTGFSGFWGDIYVSAYFYDGGSPQDLQPLLNDFCSVGSRGYDINDSGQVTGYCIYYYDAIWGHESGNGFLYDGNTMIDLGPLGIKAGTAINNSGHITGGRTTPAGTRAFIYDGMTTLDLGNDYSYGHDINDTDHVTGEAEMSDGLRRAFLYDGTTVHDLGHLGGHRSIGYGVNENDQVVGNSKTINGYTVAFLYDNSRMLSLCAVTDCAAKGWSRLISANDINDHGDITGYGVINGENHAFLARPMTGVDTDDDGIVDTADNCTLVPNPAQRDTDADGYGNYCDPDFDNNLVVNAGDLSYLKSVFFTADPDADLNGDGIVNAGDLAIVKSFFFKPPGPSGLVP